MADFGLDMLPTLYLSCEDGKRIVVRDAGEIPRMLRAGLRGPAPVTADNVIQRVYRDTTPGGKVGSHWRISPLPPPAFYDRITELFRALEVERKAKGWPELICCPIDEVDPSCKEFGVKVYAAVKAAGLKTYATKDPMDPDAAAYAPYLDIWCSQPYSVPFERIVRPETVRILVLSQPQRRRNQGPPDDVQGRPHDLWLRVLEERVYHADPLALVLDVRAGPIRLPARGIIPGVGSGWTTTARSFPRSTGPASVRVLTMPAMSIRSNRAVVQRQDSADPACQAAVREGRRLLQETWDSIRVQPKYLATGMWPSEEFDAIRWRLAAATEKLLRHPAADRRDSPSVLIDGTDTPPAKVQPLSPFEQAADVGRFETFDLGGGFSNWVNGTAEGKIRITERARHEGKTGLRWTVTVDWEHDGGEGGKYPIGWPRINRSFKPGELDLSRYDSLVFWIRVDSSHDQAGTHRTPIGVVIGSHTVRRSLYGKIVDLGGREHAWTALRFSVPEIMASAGGSAEPWKSISLVQLFISESNFPHGTRLVFDVGEVLAQRMKEPALVGVDAPHHLLLPCRRLSLTFEAAGMTAVSKGSHRISVALERPGWGDWRRGPAGPGGRKSDDDRLPGLAAGHVPAARDHR